MIHVAVKQSGGFMIKRYLWFSQYCITGDFV